VLDELQLEVDEARFHCRLSGRIASVEPRSSRPVQRNWWGVPVLEPQHASDVRKIGESVALELSCFTRKSVEAHGLPIGGTVMFKVEDIARASRVRVPVDSDGRPVEAYGMGVELIFD